MEEKVQGRKAKKTWEARGFRHIVKGTFGSYCERQGGTTEHVRLVYLDVMGSRQDENIPYTTLYLCRRERMRATCVEHVELLKAVGKVGLAAVLKGRRTEQTGNRSSKL